METRTTEGLVRQVQDTHPAAASPDLDLFEYVIVSSSDAEGLTVAATAVAELVAAGSIGLADAVVLERPRGQASVRVSNVEDHEALAGLRLAADGAVQLSGHDIELASLTLAPGQAALLLLVEDRWAHALSVAVRRSGARLSAGERIASDRVRVALEGSERHAERSGRPDLLVRGPGTTPLIDGVAQVHQLARLVDRGVLTLAGYDAQRRRVLDG